MRLIKVMHNHQIVDRLKETITPFLDSQRVELVDIIFRREGGGMVLRLLVDKSEGITLKECSDLNQKISQLLDELDLIDQSYTLEISSPGLDRPLTSERDFQRVQGKLVKIITSELIDGKEQYIGIVAEVNEREVIIKNDQNITLKIPLDKIAKARLEIDF